MQNSPRRRYREQVIGEIKQAALAQIDAGGPGALSLNAVAKTLGVSGPALYKYFRNRDELLTVLLLDAYDDVAGAVRETLEATADEPARHRLWALAAAFLGWAAAQPHRFALIAGTPLPGYEAPPESVGKARAVLGPFLTVLAQGRPAPVAGSLTGQLGEWAATTPAVADWVRTWAPDGDPALLLTTVLSVWSRLHGVVSLTVHGQFTGMGFDPAALLRAEMDAVADRLGLD
ncbi:TetR/AcrR family transcriptional regulator [Symbioplanes lichenis]|uniref:TetR/AcrR family transcriptional regulator n=1 Tax=Symbioplanes lichenis TaxID=1629072 RepID=UPI0027394056|nr:TetR/AcrR family transcriptional regulator [Actinoplanes lichenis]